MTHSPHFYFHHYGIGHVVKDSSHNELFFLISRKGHFIGTIPQTVYIKAFLTPVVEHWLEQWVHKEGRIEFFNLITHSTHFILQLYGVWHMIKNHSENERGNPLSPHGLLFLISSKGSFIYIILQTG